MIRSATVFSVCLGTAALAQSELQIDVNGLTTRANGPFSESFTGTFTAVNTPGDPDVDGDARILDVLIDGNRQNTGGADTPDFAFELNLVFDGGAILSGDVSVSHDEFGSENTYTAQVQRSASGAILEVGNGTFLIAGLTFDGLWASPNGSFLGVDISPWGSVQPVPGRFTDIAFTPDGNFQDPDSDVDVFIIPAPATVSLLAVAGLAMRRRR